MVFLNPVEDSPVTEVAAEPGCDQATREGILTFTADLRTPVPMPEGSTIVSWRKITKDGLENPIFANNIDRVMLAFYADTTPEQLEDQIFDIELLATDIWEAPREEGKVYDLLSLQHREDNGEPGAFFTSFAGHGEGTWLLALTCSFCQNPAPIVLAVLDPAAGP